MEKTTTWIVVTDGNYLKILVDEPGGTGLKHLRTDDFAQTSDLTYKLITSKRDVPAEDGLEYHCRLLGNLLSDQAGQAAYHRLLLVAPDGVLEQMKRLLPAEVRARITDTLTGDHLHTPLDILEERLSEQLDRQGS